MLRCDAARMRSNNRRSICVVDVKMRPWFGCFVNSTAESSMTDKSKDPDPKPMVLTRTERRNNRRNCRRNGRRNDRRNDRKNGRRNDRRYNRSNSIVVLQFQENSKQAGMSQATSESISQSVARAQQSALRTREARNTS